VTTADIDASTVARQRELHDLMEKFITLRRRAFIPRAREIAAEAGIDEAALAFLAHLRQISEGDFVPRERLRHRLCYSSREPWRGRFDVLAAAGLAAPAEGGWRLTARGLAVVERVWSAIHEQLRSLAIPAEPLRRTLALLERTVGDARAGEYDRLTMIRRCAPSDRARAHEAVRLEQAMFETCVLLDDGHIAAWRSAGYRGPELDVLTKVWYGSGTREALRQALRAGQEPEDVERHIAQLVARGDLAADGETVALTPQGRAARDRIEEDTNRLGLSRWPRGDELERAIADVDAILGAFPPEDRLPTGPTH